MPLWAQLEAELRTRLDEGEFDDGFPTDAQLVSRYGVSRHTVREAIRHLNKTGILKRERGPVSYTHLTLPTNREA